MNQANVSQEALTTGTIFRAKCPLYSYLYRFIGVDLTRNTYYILLENLDTNTMTLVEPEWFRQRTITIERERG